MPRWLRELDDLLRGKKGRPELLAKGTEHLPAGLYAVTSLGLGAAYGLSMGLYAVLSRTPPVYPQLLASAVKVPALFFLTLLVSYPSLYVFSALLRVELGPLAILRMIVCAITVTMAVLASFAPITAFFTLTTTSYLFMKLLSFSFFTVAGAIGLRFLTTMLRSAGQAEPLSSAEEPAGGPPEPAVVRPVTGANRLFRAWLVLYALVGAQMAWILRPFIGAPDLPFAWFRQRGGNVFVDVLHTVREFLSP
jgi:hypothetical protein